MVTCCETSEVQNWLCGVAKISITYNMMHYEGCPVSSYYVIAKFASVQIIFGATVYGKQYQRSGPEDLQDQGTEEEWQTIQRRRKKHGRTYGGETQGSRRTQQSQRHCAYCGEPNHSTSMCRHGQEVTCHCCGLAGHKEKFCRR